jgi:predicted TIM-barrel fold metal-dependent hydrolase
MIDVSVHPAPRTDREFREFLPEPWKNMRLNHLFGERYAPPFEDHHAVAKPSPGSFPGSDPLAACRYLFDESDVDVAILLPLTRGLEPDPQHGSKIAAATNEWLASTWLTDGTDSRLRGSIRVCPTDIGGALAEIERWGPDHRFVQIAVPLSSTAPYGQERYLPIWKAAAKYGLPVAVHADGSGGIDLPPTMAGYPAHFAEFHSLNSMTSVVHLASLICEGAFSRVPGLTFVFADGGMDICRMLLWRLSKDWKSARYEVPWVDREPADYLTEHVRFVTQAEEGPDDDSRMKTLLEMVGAENLLMFGSSFPFWNMMRPTQVCPVLPDLMRQRILNGNAWATYPRLGTSQ